SSRSLCSAPRSSPSGCTGSPHELTRSLRTAQTGSVLCDTECAAQSLVAEGNWEERSRNRNTRVTTPLRFRPSDEQRDIGKSEDRRAVAVDGRPYPLGPELVRDGTRQTIKIEPGKNWAATLAEV